MDQARGPVLQRPLQVEDSIQFLHQRIRECNACLPYTGDMTPPPPPPRTSPLLWAQLCVAVRLSGLTQSQ